MSEKRWYLIEAASNGYTIKESPVGRVVGRVWVARSWAEVLEILQDVGAPDYVPEEVEGD